MPQTLFVLKSHDARANPCKNNVRVAKPDFIELPDIDPIPILYEDRSVLAIDKPFGWMLVPFSWQKTQRNLQAALVSSISAGDFWARSRGLKFLRFVHRLDADTTGILLFAKSQGGVESYSQLFESRRMEKTYLAVVAGVPKQDVWTCRLKLGPDPRRIGRQRVDARNGKEAETHFRVLQRGQDKTLIEAHPLTGRTHQIRIHLAESGCPCVGDELYGKPDGKLKLGLRAAHLAYADPFTRRRVEIYAPPDRFCRNYGFEWKEQDGDSNTKQR
jgi:RluA family pseudouridine synthase